MIAGRGGLVRCSALLPRPAKCREGRDFVYWLDRVSAWRKALLLEGPGTSKNIQDTGISGIQKDGCACWKNILVIEFCVSCCKD